MPTVVGTSGADTLNGLSGDNLISGGDGADKLNGGAGMDTLDGGAGADTLSGNSGNDLLVFNGADAPGATADVYDGGSGIDILQLNLTSSQWFGAKFQADLVNYQTFLAVNTNQHTLEATNAIFNFTAFPLSVSKIEQFTVSVNGHTLSIADDPVTALNDTLTVNEDSSATSGNLLANDMVPDLVGGVQVGAAAHGTVSLATSLSDPFNASATATYTPDHAFFDHLAAGVTATDTFTYT
ncbi:MAG TPA: hypothetical protein VLI41_04745, partial [Phenylobacterium sp.]|uniref:Ig-like domain-containing protein n=1 Tax=Phenylobacterium sp. TaxID=1871053 RepID=UPI002D1A2CF7|nr:hypothetical protein [Phenylobacterium sp.]